MQPLAEGWATESSRSQHREARGRLLSGIIHVIVFTNRRVTCHRTTFITPALSHAAVVSPCTCVSSAFFACMACNCTHRTHHRCVFGVIIHTPPRTCPPITIGPPARSFHPIRAPLFEAPQATLIHRHSKTRPDRAGDTPTHDIRTVPTHMHACTAHTSAHTHHHEHKQTHTPTHRHAHTHKHTHAHPNTDTHTHTHTHPSKMICFNLDALFLPEAPVFVFILCP